VTRAFEPVARDRLELLLLRLGFALVVARPFLGGRAWPSDAPFPTGIAKYVDLTWLGDPAGQAVATIALAGSLLLYASGRCLVPALAVMLAVTTSVFTLKNSQAGVAHHLHVIPLAIFGQLVGVLRHRLGSRDTVGGRARVEQDYMVHDALQCIAAIYLTAGLVKLLDTGAGWFQSADSAVLWIAQAQEESFHSTDESGGFATSGAVVSFLAAHPDFCRLFFGAGLLLELLAPLAIMGRVAAAVFGAGWIAFHLGNGVLMDLWFWNNTLVVLLLVSGAPFLLARGLTCLAASVGARRRKPRQAS
jgi:hypothetical protein